MRDFEAVVFDMDGVIFDSERAIMGCWQEVATRHDIQDLEKNFMLCVGVTAKRTREIMLEAYGEDFPYDDFDKEASALFHEKYDGGRLPMKSGVVEILEFLKSSGKKIALASSTKRENVVAQLRDAGVLDYFEELVTGDMVTHSKPHPEIFLLACEKIGVKPSDAYAIEDSFNGIRSASSGGLRPIMVPDLLPADDEMRNLAETVEGSLEDVIRYLEA